MGRYDRLIGIEEYTGARVDDRISPDMFCTLLGEYSRGILARGFMRPQSVGINQKTAQTGTSVLNTSQTVEAGHLCVLVAHSESSKLISSVADVDGNTWTVHVSGTGGTGTDGMSVASATAATDLVAADNVTVTWDAATSATMQYNFFEVVGAASSPFDIGAVVYQATEAAVVELPADSVPCAVLAGFHGSSTFDSVEGTEDILSSSTSGAFAGVRGTVYSQQLLHIAGTWSNPGDGVGLAALFKADASLPFLPDYVERELSSPLNLLEREKLDTFCDAIDAAGDAHVYIQEIHDVLSLTHRQSPGYRDQNEIIARLGVT